MDDGSTDGSLDFLRYYAETDRRVKIITHNENKSLLQARKTGTLEANGEYLMFVDSDDSLDVNACANLYSLMEKQKVDIIHFGTYVDSEEHILPETTKWIENVLKPHEGLLYGRDIAYCCFKKREYIWSVWGKIYSTDIVKKAVLGISEIYLNYYEDFYLYFLITNEAKSYLGINEKYYHYKYGRGMTSNYNMLNEKGFKVLCQVGFMLKEVRNLLVTKEDFSVWESTLDI